MVNRSVNLTNQNGLRIALSPLAYNLLGQEKFNLRSRGLKATRRELADKAIIAAYGQEAAMRQGVE